MIPRQFLRTIPKKQFLVPTYLRTCHRSININDSFAHNPVELEMLDVDLFRSKSLWRPIGARAVYGGQVVGQALAASQQCVSDSKELHSLHSYFLKGGNPDIPILYRVRKLSVTNNFEMHNISAKQHGQTIFSCSASYHRPEKSDLFHQREMPAAPDPSTLASQEQILESLVVDPRLPQHAKHLILAALKTPFPIDVREVDPPDFFSPKKKPEAKKLVWMKARTPAHIVVDANMHRCLAAFASDWGLAVASLLPHGILPGSQKLKIVTSLDHSMHFHAPFHANEWMLFDMRSVKLSGGRGMNMGYIYNASGELVITTTQESLIRLKPRPENNQNQ